MTSLSKARKQFDMALRYGTLTASALLVACGGGDGGGPIDANPPAAPAGPAAPSVPSIPAVPAVPVAVGRVAGQVTHAITGAGLPNITVRAGAQTATTAADGSYVLPAVVAGNPIAFAFTGSGFAAQSRLVEPVAGADISQVVNVPMLPVAVVDTFDPAVARTTVVPNSTAQVQLPANALRTASGAMPVGAVTARLTPVSPNSNPALMPGNYLASTAGGNAPIESFGALHVTYTDATGAPLNLAAGTTAVLRIPVSAKPDGPAPATVPLFYFDAATGLWKQEQSATLAGVAPNQYYQGSVPHFSYWNADLIYQTVAITGCVQNAAGERLNNVNIGTEGVSYTGRAFARSNSAGNFTIAAKSSSRLILGAERSGFVSNQRLVVSTAGDVTIPECLVLGQPLVTGQPAAGSSLSVRLSWGGAPRDLDSHTKGPNASNEIYFGGRGSLTLNPFVALDVDNTSGFGPEFITFAKLAKNRQYSYFVNNYSGSYSPGQTGSPAQVQLVNNGIQTIYTPPAGETNSTPYWHVFNVTTDANCVPTIVPVQRFMATSPPNLNTDNNAQFCN